MNKKGLLCILLTIFMALALVACGPSDEKLSQAEKEAQIEAIDFSKKSDKKLDEIIAEITTLTESYQNIQKSLDGTLSSETQTKEEAAKNVGIGSYIINSTDMNITEVVLHDITADTYSDNLLGDGVTLNAGYTLMGISLDIHTDSSEWEFIIKDENNTSYTIACDSLLGLDENGASFEFTYDKTTGTGNVIIGGYTTN